MLNDKKENQSLILFHSVNQQTPESILDSLETIHNRKSFHVLCSGGKDSISTADWLAKQGKLSSVIHIQTNIGVKKTTEFVKELCKEQHWKLNIVEPTPKFVYAAWVLEHGFPSAGIHNVIMGKLKYHAMRKFAFKADKLGHVLISGVRKFESVRRMGNYKEPIMQDDRLWFGSPFFYKTSDWIYRYIHENGLRITPIHDLLGFSGECMCGSFAGHGEKLRLKQVDPELADYIQWLEEGVQRFGTKQAKKYPKWGDSAKMSDLEQQQYLTQFIDENPDLKSVAELEPIICGVECGSGTMRGMSDY